ncbi:fibronectin type III domain-containing protein, partial [Patescibacteria group bacterium]
GCDFSLNYELYYCRDAGGVGTADDLPAIGSDPATAEAVIRGINKVCSDTKASCSVPGDCPTGTCDYDVFKEVFFFREAVPAQPIFANFTVTDTMQGESVNVTWLNVAGADGYKFYWGTSPGNYDSFATIIGASTPDPESTMVTCAAPNNCDIIGLNNNVTYYFNITSYNNAGGESAYIQERSAMPTDQVAPAAPTTFWAQGIDSQVELRWDPDPVGDVDRYKVYYGTDPTPGIYGGSQEVGLVNAAVIAGLTNGTLYYFAVTAIDAEGNESGFSSHEPATPTAMVAGSFGSGEIVAFWSVSGGGQYSVYIEVIP